MDFDSLREFMVKTQIIPRGIKDERVLNAMKKVPRHLFVDDSMQNRAYDDMALPSVKLRPFHSHTWLP
jgi:protein-L-isoaspartate(D-aspartate) O-methyltransferase